MRPRSRYPLLCPPIEAGRNSNQFFSGLSLSVESEINLFRWPAQPKALAYRAVRLYATNNSNG